MHPFLCTCGHGYDEAGMVVFCWNKHGGGRAQKIMDGIRLVQAFEMAGEIGSAYIVLQMVQAEVAGMIQEMMARHQSRGGSDGGRAA